MPKICIAEIKAVAALLGVSGVALYRGFTTKTRNTRGQVCKSLADVNTVSNLFFLIFFSLSKYLLIFSIKNNVHVYFDCWRYLIKSTNIIKKICCHPFIFLSCLTIYFTVI